MFQGETSWKNPDSPPGPCSWRGSWRSPVKPLRRFKNIFYTKH